MAKRFNQRRNHHREKQAALLALSANMLPPPDVFDEDKMYRVKLTKSVIPTDHQLPLRPSQDVLVNGKVANEIREHIHSARMI